MSKMKTELQFKKISDFIHESMCIDGFVIFDSFVDEIVRHGKTLKGILFEVRDKKRGTFYIAWLSDNETFKTPKP